MRIVSASQRPLEEEIQDGRFREDLYFRVNTVAIHLPPLRERREDVPILALTFLDEFRRERGKPIEGFSDDVIAAFDVYPWPGNVRELRNVVERAVLFCTRPRIGLDELPETLRAGNRGGKSVAAEPVLPLQEAVQRAEVEAIRAALAATGGRRARAAELLGISRKTLWEKAKQYGLDV